MLLLRSLEKLPIFEPPTPPGFPHTVPAIASLQRLDFVSPVTFLAGENGSGKSTLLEAIACAAGSITVGSESVATDPTLHAVRQYSRSLRLSWSKRTKKGFFMRAEDFFGYARKMSEMRAELERDLRQVDHDYHDRSPLARDLAKMPYAGQIGALQRSYGDGLDSNSHGEGFLKLFQQRFTGPGLYLLDEPEAPLSPTRQLTLLSLLKRMTDQGAQFIIASHSPILMAYPEAQILTFDGGLIRSTPYETLEHVVVTRTFLENPGAYLRYLMEEDEAE